MLLEGQIHIQSLGPEIAPCSRDPLESWSVNSGGESLSRLLLKLSLQALKWKMRPTTGSSNTVLCIGAEASWTWARSSPKPAQFENSDSKPTGELLISCEACGIPEISWSRLLHRGFSSCASFFFILHLDLYHRLVSFGTTVPFSFYCLNTSKSLLCFLSVWHHSPLSRSIYSQFSKGENLCFL